MRVLNKKHWPIQITTHGSDDRIDLRDAWCKQTLGRNCTFFVQQWTGVKVFAFKEESDLLMFKIRWPK